MTVMQGSNDKHPGLLISAPQGRSGKTIAALALCAALRKQGLKVQPFKKGPDYIDPSWLSEAAGRSCHNLDSFLMSSDMILNSYACASEEADLSIVEGAMGLYDGPEPTGQGSSAHLARLLNLPVILVVDCTRMTGSIAAMVKGYQEFQPDIHIAGVILNNVAGPRHKYKLTSAVEHYCGIPVVGTINRDSDLQMTQRHLGHIPFPESIEAGSTIKTICDRVAPGLDLSTIMTIAKSDRSKVHPLPSQNVQTGAAAKVKIGIIKDRAFNFYYTENLQSLQDEGAELVLIDSLRDALPEIDGLYIGGGFPEFFLKELEDNRMLRWQIAGAVEEGLPVYAECAGLMYLCQSITWQGKSHKMVGVIPAEIELSRKPQGHGYVESEIASENPLFPVGMTLRGHEFHHSKLTAKGDLEFAYRIKRGHGIGDGQDGVVYKNVFAAYTHLHALGTPQWAKSFVALVLRQKEIQQPVVATISKKN